MLYNFVLPETWHMMYPLLLSPAFQICKALGSENENRSSLQIWPTSHILSVCTSSISLVWAPQLHANMRKIAQDRKKQLYCKNRRCKDIAIMLFIPTCDMISPPQCPNRSRLVETFDAMMLEELNRCNFEDPLCHCKDQGPGEGFGLMTVEVLHVKPKMNVNPPTAVHDFSQLPPK